MRRYLLLVIGLLLSTTINLSSAQDGEGTNPYIYYYSQELNAFVIEHVDGTDHKILAHYEIPEEQIGIRDVLSGPGWSPSGEWFAWTLRNNERPGVLDAAVYLVDRNGGDVVEVPGSRRGSTNSDIDVLWSPNRDVLLTSLSYPPGVDTDLYTHRVFTYDASTGTVHLLLDTYEEDVDFLLQEWSPSGKFSLVYYKKTTEGDAPEFRMRITDLNGESRERAIDIDDRCALRTLPQSSPDNHVAYLDPDSGLLTVEGFSGEDSPGQLEVNEPILELVDWNPAGSHALMYFTEGCNDNNINENYPIAAYLFDREQNSLTFITDHAHYPRGYYIRGGLFIERGNYFYHLYNFTNWSPNGDRAVVVTETSFYSIELSMMQFDEIPLPAEGTPIIIRWDNDTAVIGLTSRQLSTIFSHDFETSSQKIELQLNEPLGYVDLPPDDIHIAYAAGYDGFLVSETGETNQIIFSYDPSLPVDGITLSAFQWHSSGKWAFIFGDNHFNVINAEGTYQRILGVCDSAPSCFGWLP